VLPHLPVCRLCRVYLRHFFTVAFAMFAVWTGWRNGVVKRERYIVAPLSPFAIHCVLDLRLRNGARRTAFMRRRHSHFKPSFNMAGFLSGWWGGRWTLLLPALAGGGNGAGAFPAAAFPSLAAGRFGADTVKRTENHACASRADCGRGAGVSLRRCGAAFNPSLLKHAGGCCAW